jgi:hypothetical protein
MRACVALALLCAAALADPRFEVSPPSYGFGQIQIGDTARFSFAVTNTGSDIGNFRAEMSGIGQGIVLDPSQEPYLWRVAPGDTARVAVLFQPSGAGYRHRVLVIRWSIYFSWNDVSGTGAPPDTLYPPQNLTLASDSSQLLLRWTGGGPFFRVYSSPDPAGPFEVSIGATRYRQLAVPFPNSGQQFYVVVSTDQVP